MTPVIDPSGWRSVSLSGLFLERAMTTDRARFEAPWTHDLGAMVTFCCLLASGFLYAWRRGADPGLLSLDAFIFSLLFFSARWASMEVAVRLFEERPWPLGSRIVGGAFFLAGLGLGLYRLYRLAPEKAPYGLSFALAGILVMAYLVWMRQTLGNRHALVLIASSLAIGMPALWLAFEAPRDLSEALSYWLPLELFFPGALAVLEAWMQSAWRTVAQRSAALLPHLFLALLAALLAPGWQKALALAVLGASAWTLFYVRFESRRVDQIGWVKLWMSLGFCLGWSLGPWR